MTIEQDAQETNTPFAERVWERILVWFRIAGGPPSSLSVRFRRMAIGKRKSTWVAFAIVLAGNIIAFNYYQARVTRYYISVLLENLVRMNEDIDALQAKLNQLSKRTDGTGASLDNPEPPSSAVLTTSRPSSSAKPRRR
jgi:hypothetical protein